MDRAYKLTNVQRREEWKSKYSQNGQFDMVDYAIALEGEDGWIKLSQKITTRPPTIGDELFGHLETKESRNGTSYRKFQKAQRGPGGSNVDPTRIEYIVQMLEELTGRRKVEDTVVPLDDELDDPFKGLGV